jgi:hypothetical protein
MATLQAQCEPAFSVPCWPIIIEHFMLNQCLENTSEGLLHACISSYILYLIAIRSYAGAVNMRHPILSF